MAVNMVTHSKSKPTKRARLARRALQWAVGILALVPICAGLAGIIFGTSMITDTATTIPMDSHFRYLSGLLLGIGFGFWSMIPNIEKNTRPFQMMTVIVVIGGLGRLYSFVVAGAPDGPMLFGLTMELIIVPIIAVCQYAIANNDD
jgi:hypothetical protein